MDKKLDISESDACAYLLYKCSKNKINRNTLRTILKKNNYSYHKPGPKNHMKTVTEMDEIVNKASKHKLNIIIKNLLKRNSFLV